MAFDPKFSRDVLLPLAVHAYTVADIPHDCESLNTTVYKIAGIIEVDPATCREVWSRLELQARESGQPAGALRTSEMLASAMADGHTFGFVASTDTDVFVCIRGTHFLIDWLKDADLPLVDYRFRSGGAGLAHMGFQAVYETIRQSILDLLASQGTKAVTDADRSQPRSCIDHDMRAGREPAFGCRSAPGPRGSDRKPPRGERSVP